MASYASITLLHLSFACPQGPGRVPLSNLDSRQGPEEPQASKGAAQFFQGLAVQAAQTGIAVDVLAVGQAAVNVPMLGSLTQKTGGTIMSHQRKLPNLWSIMNATPCESAGHSAHIHSMLEDLQPCV